MSSCTNTQDSEATVAGAPIFDVMIESRGSGKGSGIAL